MFTRSFSTKQTIFRNVQFLAECFSSFSSRHPHRIGERDAFVGKWLKVKNIDYRVRGKTILNYEMIERTTRRQDTNFDAVSTFAIIEDVQSLKIKQNKLIVIANYRAPVDKYVLEIPAGLMDCPDVLKNAIRELKEETGYIASIDDEIKLCNSEITPTTYTDPWRSIGSQKSIFLRVNPNKQQSKTPQQELEDTEDIAVHLVQIDRDILDSLINLAEQNSYLISAGLWNFAQGIAFAERYNTQQENNTNP